MIITYVFTDGEGSREKFAAMKGLGAGDVTCEWQQLIKPPDSFKLMKESFKSAMLVYLDGTPLPAGGGDDDDDDDDD